MRVRVRGEGGVGVRVRVGPRRLAVLGVGLGRCEQVQVVEAGVV